MQMYVAAVALEIGLPPAPGPPKTLAVCFFLAAESEEAAESLCVERAREEMANTYGLTDGDRWRVLDFSAELVPGEALKEAMEMCG